MNATYAGLLQHIGEVSTIACDLTDLLGDDRAARMDKADLNRIAGLFHGHEIAVEQLRNQLLVTRAAVLTARARVAPTDQAPARRD